MPAINVARTDTFEVQRQKINQIGDILSNISAGGSDLQTGNLKLGDGSRSVPSLSFINEGDLGIYRPNTGTIGFVGSGKNIFDVQLDSVSFYKDIFVRQKKLFDDGISFVSGGSGYEAGDYIDIPLVGGSGTGATANFTVSAFVGTVNNSGSGYNDGLFSNVNLVGGSGSGAVVTFNVNDLRGDVTNPGTGYVPGFYENVSLVSTTGTGSGGIATVSIGGLVTYSGSITSPGSGYQQGIYNSISLLNVPTQTFTVTTTSNPSPPPNELYQINGVTQQTLSLVAGNTYRFDVSDPSTSSHPFAFNDAGGNPLNNDFYSIVYKGTQGSAGAFVDLIIKPEAAGETINYYCISHSGMGSTINITSGATGSYGNGLVATVNVDANGNVIGISNLNVFGGGGYLANQVLTVYNGDVGGTGSGFEYTTNAPLYAGEISNISVSDSGSGYSVGDLLTINNADVGGYGSGFEYTVSSNPGIISDLDFTDFGSGYQIGDILSLPPAVTNVSTYFQDLIENVSTTLSSSSPQITISDTTGIFPGMIVINETGDAGTLPQETKVLTVDSSTQVTLSNNPLTSGAATLSFSPENFSSIYLSSTSGIFPGFVVTKVSGTGVLLDNISVLSVDGPNYITLNSQPAGTGDVVLDFNPTFGSGVGQFEFEIESLGDISEINISSGGNGYNLGDTLSVNASLLTQPIVYPVTLKSGQKITFSSSVVSGTFSIGDIVKIRDGEVQSVLQQSSTSIPAAANQVYSNVQSTSSGNGLAATFNIERDPNGDISDVSVNNSGYFYQNGDTITISGSLVGGSSPTDDLTLEVSGVVETSSHEIFFVKESGGFVDYVITEGSSFEVNDILYDSGLNLYTVQTQENTNRYYIDTGSGPSLTPNLTLYSGNSYEFDYSDNSNNGHTFSLSEFRDGFWSPSLVDNVTTTLTLGQSQITVADTSNIRVGMIVSDVDPENYSGNLIANTKVLSVDGPTTVTLDKNPISEGGALIRFSGYEYTDGVTRSTSSLIISVSDSTPSTLYYFDSNESLPSHSNAAGEDGEESIVTVDLNNPKTFGSGFSLEVLDLQTTDVMSSLIEEGKFTSQDIVSTNLTSTTGSIDNLSFITGEGTKLIIDELESSEDILVDAENLNVSANLKVGSTATLEASTGNFTTTGEIKTSTRLNVDDTVFIVGNQIQSTSNTNLQLSPPTGNVVEVVSTTALGIPSGNTSQRPTTSYDGYIRFNNQTNQYEGYSATNQSWSSLGGVRDLDGNTTILAEESVGSNDNTLWFINDNVNTLRVTPQYQEFVNVKKVRSVNTSAPDYQLWVANDVVALGDFLKYRNNIYEVTAVPAAPTTPRLATSGNEPTHTSGSALSGNVTLTYYTSAVSFLTFEEISEVRIDPLGFTDLVINADLRLANNVISTDVNDLKLKPKSGQKVVVDATTSLVIPVGDNNSKGNAARGSIRFNTDILQYEGFDGTNWSSLGGVRDVDGNTYIIPETAPGENENILYFYNDNNNTLRVTTTQIELDSIDTITSTSSSTLNFNASTVTFDSLATTLDNTSNTSSYLFSTKDNLDFGLSSGVYNDHLLRLTSTGDVIFNLGFGTGTPNNLTILNDTLTKFELSSVKIATDKFTLVRGTSNTGNATVYTPSIESSAKVCLTAHNLTTGAKELVEYYVVDDGTDVYFTDYNNVKTSSELVSVVFDIGPSNNIRILITLSNALSAGDQVLVTLVKTVTKR